MSTYRISAINDAVSSENRIHSDAVARKFGFSGALVSGVSLFGYLSRPLVADQGAGWLENTVVEVTFLKPAYEGELLAIEIDNSPESGKPQYRQASVFNPGAVLLARLESWQPDSPEPVDSRAALRCADQQAERPQIHWDLIDPGRPAPTYELVFTPAIQQAALELMRDDLTLYRQGSRPPVHPYLLLKECNKALMRMFVLPAWIHVGSRLVLRQPVRVGQPLDVVTVPVDKWERKGHQFIRLYVSMHNDDGVALEVMHTAIFRIAGT